MHTLLSILQWFMFIPVNMIMIFYFLNRNLTIKSNNFYLKYGFPILFLITESFLYFYNSSLYNGKIKILLNTVLIAYFMLSFKEKLTKKIYIYASTYVIIGVAESIVHLTTMLTGIGIIYPIEVSIRVIIVLSCYNFLAFLMLSAFTRFNLRKNNKKDNNGFEMFALVPFSQLFLGESLFANYIDGKLSRQNLLLFSLGMVISAITDILLFRSIRLIQESERNKEKINTLKYKQELESAYYENIQKNIEQTMKYRHDINNMLTTAYSMANSGNQQIAKEGIKFLDELKSKNEVLNMPVYSSNPVINAVVYDKNSTASELNIDFEIHLDVPQDMDIALTDLCSVFSNLIDNAFNAAVKSNNKKVILSAWSDIGYLFVKTKNYPDDVKDFLSGNKHSLMDEHGYGMEIMKDISEKYDGEFTIKVKENCVIAACSMRYIKPGEGIA